MSCLGGPHALGWMRGCASIHRLSCGERQVRVQATCSRCVYRLGPKFWTDDKQKAKGRAAVVADDALGKGEGGMWVCLMLVGLTSNSSSVSTGSAHE